jgi:hypothetical protein
MNQNKQLQGGTALAEITAEEEIGSRATQKCIIYLSIKTWHIRNGFTRFESF